MQTPAVQIIHEREIGRLMQRLEGSEVISKLLSKHGKLATMNASLNRLDVYKRCGSKEQG